MMMKDDARYRIRTVGEVRVVYNGQEGGKKDEMGVYTITTKNCKH